MQDPRKIRQTAQTLLALAMIVAPVALAVPFDWRALVVATLGGIMAILTNPRLVAGLGSQMPEAGSSAVLPVTKLVANPEGAAPTQSPNPTPVTIPIRPPVPRDPTA